MTWRHAFILLPGLVAACGQSAAPHRDLSRPSGPARIESTLALRGGAGAVHVIAIPDAWGEVTRCVVATTSAGGVATSCAPKALEILPPDD